MPRSDVPATASPTVAARTTPLVRPLLRAAAVPSAAAAVVHAAAARSHSDDWWLASLALALAALFQLGWAAAAAFSSASHLSAAGIAGNAVILAVWAGTRTAGLPFGPHGGAAEPVGPADLVTTAFEVAIVVACMASGGRARPARPAGRLVATSALVVVPLTAVALSFSGTHGRSPVDAARPEGVHHHGHVHARP